MSITRLTPGNGSIVITNNFSFGLQESYRPEVITMILDDVDDADILISNPQLIAAPILLPPYQARLEYENGNDNGFCNLYDQHIREYCSKIVAAILMNMCNGKNIILYIPDHSYQPSMYLLNFFNRYHGIIVGTDRNMFMYNHKMNDDNIRFMYTYNVINAMDVIFNIDLECLRIDMDLLHRIVVELQPPVVEFTVDGFVNYFIEYVNQSRKVDTYLTDMTESTRPVDWSAIK